MVKKFLVHLGDFSMDSPVTMVVSRTEMVDFDDLGDHFRKPPYGYMIYGVFLLNEINAIVIYHPH